MLYHLNVFVSIKFKWKIASEHFSDFIGGICTLQWLNAALRWSILGGKLNTWSTGKFCGKRQPLSHAVSWMFLTNLALCQLTVLRLILKGFFSIHLFWFDPHTDLAAFRATNKVHFPWQDKSLPFICSLYILQRLRELRQRESTRNICKFFCTYWLYRIKLLYLYNEINVTLKNCEILL